MFGPPVSMGDKMAVFHLVWTYAIKALEFCKKERWDQDRQRSWTKHMPTALIKQARAYFYAISAAENLLFFGVDMSNTFA